jgi:hypothetical protein
LTLKRGAYWRTPRRVRNPIDEIDRLRPEDNRSDQAETARPSARHPGRPYNDYRRFEAEQEAMGAAPFFLGERCGVLPFVLRLAKGDGKADDRRRGETAS